MFKIIFKIKYFIIVSMLNRYIWLTDIDVQLDVLREYFRTSKLNKDLICDIDISVNRNTMEIFIITNDVIAFNSNLHSLTYHLSKNFSEYTYVIVTIVNNKLWN